MSGLNFGMRHKLRGDSSAVRRCDGRELEQFVYNLQSFNLFKQVYPPSLLQKRILRQFGRLSKHFLYLPILILIILILRMLYHIWPTAVVIWVNLL